MSSSTENPEREFNPKHRVVGAIVLVGLGVIFFPMLLENHQSGVATTASTPELGQQNKKIFVSKITPVNPADVEPENKAAEQKAAPKPAPAKKVAAAETKPAPAKKAAKAKKSPAPAKPVAEAKAAEVKTGWAVRIGTFARHENAQRIVTVLKRKGFKPRTENIETAGARATRVWLGPYAEKTEAQKIRAEILDQTGQQGLIVSYP